MRAQFGTKGLVDGRIALSQSEDIIYHILVAFVNSVEIELRHTFMLVVCGKLERISMML